MGERGHQELLTDFADEFNAGRSDARVLPVFQGVYGTLYQKLIAALTARRPPPLSMMYEGWTTRFYDRGRLDAVESHLSGPTGWDATDRADFFPRFLENNRWGGSLLTLPMNKSAYVLQYNVDLFRRAGFAEAPRTWEELREIARAVASLRAEDGRPCRGMIVRPQLESFATLLFSAGGSFLDARWEPTLLRPEARRALAFLSDLIHRDGAARLEAAYPASVFGTGLVGMFIYSSAAFPFNDRFAAGRFQWRAAPTPRPEAGSPEARRTLFQGMNVGIFADREPEERAVAWDFLKFILEPDRAARWAIRTGYCPVRRSAVAQPAYRAFLDEHPAYAVPVGEVPSAQFEPKPDFWEAWRTDVGDEVVAALEGLKRPEEALQGAQRAGAEARRFDSKFPPRS